LGYFWLVDKPDLDIVLEALLLDDSLDCWLELKIWAGLVFANLLDGLGMTLGHWEFCVMDTYFELFYHGLSYVFLDFKKPYLLFTF